MTRCLLVASVSFLGLACTGSDDDASPRCEYEGELYEDGEQFPAGDGCNGCKCNPDGNTPGQFQCSLIDCSLGTECTTAPPNNIQQCPDDCGTSCAGSCASVCGTTCAACSEIADGEHDWVVLAIDCDCGG